MNLLNLVFIAAFVAVVYGQVEESPDEGTGFGFPLHSIGKAGKTKRLGGSNQPTDDIPPLNANDSGSGDAGEASNYDPIEGESGNFEDWIGEMKTKYENDPNRRRLNVFGNDDREAIRSDVMDLYPARCIGKLQTSAGSCTATIITHWLILTNRHCIGIQDDNTLPANWFSVSYLDVGESESEYNYRVYFNRIRWSTFANDYAIIQMREKIGSFTGYPGIRWRNRASFSVNRELSYIGYSGVFFSNNNNQPGGHFGCSSRGLETRDGDNVDVRHDCDSERGSSGSSMMEGLEYNTNTETFSYDGPYISALNWGEYRNGGDVSLYLPSYTWQNTNVMKPASVFQDDYNTAKAWSAPPTNFPTSFPTSPTNRPTPRPTFVILPIAFPTPRPTFVILPIAFPTPRPTFPRLITPRPTQSPSSRPTFKIVNPTPRPTLRLG